MKVKFRDGFTFEMDKLLCGYCPAWDDKLFGGKCRFQIYVDDDKRKCPIEKVK